MSTNSCSDDSVAELLLKLDLLPPPGKSHFSIDIQLRQAVLVQGVPPAQNNAWVYRPVPDPTAGNSKPLPTYLGPLVTARRGQELTITWRNQLPAAADKDEQIATPFPDNPAAPDSSMPAGGNMSSSQMMPCPPMGVVTHLHGGKVRGGSDGWPLRPIGFVGSKHFPQTRTYAYPNEQRATMLWYHDHGMDHTAENVHAGLAGLYFIRDEGDDRLLALLGGAEYEVPLVVQDRLLAGKGEAFNYQTGIPRGDNRGEFLGTVLFTNGRPSPKLRVQRRYYRLRLLNGSNARTYALALYNPDTREWLSDRLTLVGTEGGLLAKPLHTAKKPNPDNGAGTLVFAPAERRDVLLDLHGLEGVERLQLVNLAVKSWVEATASPATTEGIYTTAADSIVAPADVTPSYQDLPLFRVLDLCLQGSEMPKPAGFWDKVRDLALHADEDGFHWNHVSRSIEPNSWAARKNRLILLWNNTLKDGDWDVRLCEMGTEPPKEADCSDGQCGPEKQWLPFDVNLAAPLPAPDAQPAPALHEPTGQDYYILRRSFFKDPEVHCDSTANFPELHKPNIVAKAGTYERWYIANVGNEKFGGDGGVANNPDMHPMHIHLVNFIVTRRWKRDDTKQAFTLQDRPLPGCCTTDPAILDRLARWDTVRVHPNEIVELLVYFPKGYQGQYPYHCHLVEHEDMGMMLHFEVE